MNLLILPQYAYPANHAVVNRVYEQLLPARGHAVHMIRPMAGVDKPTRVEAPWAGGSMIVYPAEQPGRPLENLFQDLRRRRWIEASMRMLGSTAIDAIVVRNGLTAGVAASEEARRRRIPWLFQISSPDAELMASEGRARRGMGGLYRRWRGRGGLMMRRRLSRQASAVLAISEAMREYFIQTGEAPAENIFAFPMGVMEDDAAGPDAVNSLRRRLNLPDGKTLVYTGVLDPRRQSEWMLDVLNLVRTRVPGTVLLVITYQEDDRRRLFEEDARRRGADVRIVGPVPFVDVGSYLRAADVMISPIPPMPEHRMSSPTKSLEGLRAGLPVVGSADIDEHVAVFSASGGGVAVPWDRAQYADAIVSLLENPARRQSMGEQGRDWVLRHRTYRHLAEYLERILQASGSPSALKDLPHSP